MPIRDSINSRLDRMNGQPKTYGRASVVCKQVQQRELPTNLLFCDECSGDLFQLSYNGATQFLRKMQIEPCRENVEWLIDGLLNTPIDDTFPLEGAELSVSCSCTFDPQGRSLAQMGIAKSMVCKEPRMPPQQYQKMVKIDGAGTRMTEGQMYMLKCRMPGAGEEGVLFGRNVLELSNALRKGTAGDGSYVGHDDTGNVGGMLGQCNVSGSHRLRAGRGWQE